MNVLKSFEYQDCSRTKLRVEDPLDHNSLIYAKKYNSVNENLFKGSNYISKICSENVLTH